MAVYLKKFENHTQYENYINGSGAILPNVSICTTEGDVHYNPYVEPIETRVVAKFNVRDTSSDTTIATDSTCFSAIEIDGVEQPSVVTYYKFSTTGEHVVKYTLTDPTSIGESAFSDCTSLTSVTIPNSVTSIGTYVFQSCGWLTSVTIPNSVTSIGEGAFANCNKLTSIAIPNSVTSIGESAFSDCTSLTSVTIPNSVTAINENTFSACENLTSCTIGSDVTSIGNYAFQYCSALTSINIPSSVTSIGWGAFGCCNNLNEDAVNAIEAINPDNAFYCD